MCRCILRLIYMIMHARYDLYHIICNNHCALTVLLQDSRFKHRLFHRYTNNFWVGDTRRTADKARILRHIKSSHSCIVWIYGLIGNKIQLKPSSNPHMIKDTAGYTHDLCVSRPDAHGVWHPCCLESFYSNRASDNILEFLSPNATGQFRSYSTVTIISRQLRSHFDSYDHTPWTVTIM